MGFGLMNLGWIKLHKRMLDWEWYDDLNVRVLFLHLLLTVNYKDKNWKGINIEKGSRITGRIQLAEETGLTQQNIRTAINKLKSTNEITTKKTHKGTMFTVVKWNEYQESNQQPNQALTTHQPETNQRLTTTKEYNNINNIIKHYGELEFIEDWNELRTKHLKKPSHLKKLTSHDDTQNFKDLKINYSRDDFRNALIGLFKQQKLPRGNSTMQSNPSHFLRYFNSYYTAYHDKNTSLYGTQKENETL